MKKNLNLLIVGLTLIICGSAISAPPDKASFFSEALGTEKTYRIYLPPDYDLKPDARFPVVYLLHGYNFARNNPDKFLPTEEENHWMDQEQLGDVAHCLFTVSDYDKLRECLEKRNVGLPDGVVEAMKVDYPAAPLPLPQMIVVMPDGDSSFYADREDGQKQWPPVDGPEFVDGFRKGATGQYETYIVNDLIRHIDSTYRTIADRDHRGVGGFSMGGIGSMNLLLGHPDVFVSVTSLSALYNLADMLGDPFSQSYMKGATPEIATIFSKTPAGADTKIDKEYVKKYDPCTRLRNMTRTDVKVYYDAGSGDSFSGRNNFEGFRKFDKELAKKGLTASPAVHIIPGNELNAKGWHTARYWRSRIGNILAFHAAAFGMLK